MIVRKFLAWSATASPAERAPAAAALARALMSGELPPEEEAEASLALAGLADDPAPLVRLALSGELAAHANAPRHVVIALAADQSEIAAPVLRASPLLTDADLVDAAAIGDALSQTAIALRETVSAPVCAALSEVGLRECVVALLGNPGAAVPRDALARIVERFAGEADVREALLRRDDLPPAERAHLVEAAAQTLQDFVTACGWMPAARAERAAREAREKGLVIIAAEAANDRAAASMARCLRQAGRLTPALLLRSLLSGERRLFQSALAELSGVEPDQAAGCVENFNGGAFAALYCRSSLPESLLPVFRSALAALADGPGQDEFADGGLLRTLVERVLADAERAGGAQQQAVTGLLRRFLAEAARQEAREFSAWLARADAMAGVGQPPVESQPTPQNRTESQTAPAPGESPQSAPLTATPKDRVRARIDRVLGAAA